MGTDLDLFNSTFAHPVQEFASLQRKWDRLCKELTGADMRPNGKESTQFLPACDVEETGNQYLISLDIPGIPLEKIQVELAGNTLTVSGDLEEERKEKYGKRRLLERSKGHFERSFTLSGILNSEKVEANYKDGVLKISVPKSQINKARRIPIGEGRAGFTPPFNKSPEKKEAKISESRVA